MLLGIKNKYLNIDKYRSKLNTVTSHLNKSFSCSVWFVACNYMIDFLYTFDST